MAQKKLFRFEQIKTFANVLEYPQDMAGKWKDFFKNENPLMLELACGRGEYTVALAAMHPEINYLGVDVKGNRMYIGARKALNDHISNAGFLRTQIEKISEYFAPGEVDEIWITFPDPQLRGSRAKKRLTHPRFLRLYHKILKPTGIIHLKTDSPPLYHFTKMVADLYGLQVLEDRNDVYADPGANPQLKIKTHYESLDISESTKVFYLALTLPEVIPDRDNDLKKLLDASNPAKNDNGSL
jgi:tRNA (guanine-N7-)-methyltransferase